MMFTGFRQVDVNVNDRIGYDYLQIIQIVNDIDNTCYEIVKHNETGSLLVHFMRGTDYYVKEFIDNEVTLKTAIQMLGLDPQHFKFYEDCDYYSVENMLATKVTELPLLTGHTCPIGWSLHSN